MILLYGAGGEPGRGEIPMIQITELLDPMAKVIDEPDETKTEQPETKDDNMEMLAKLLANPETASLLKALAKNL